jgi:hypothetical protein
MAKTTIALRGVEVVSRRIPKKRKRLGQMLVFSDEITVIDGAVSPGPSQHTGFCIHVREPNLWLCEAGIMLPGLPAPHPFTTGGQVQARGLMDFDSQADAIVAITGGTGDYLRASGEVRVHVVSEDPTITDFTLTVETP